MKLSGLSQRWQPLKMKVTGKIPLCPWSVVFGRFDPRTLAAYSPPTKIELRSQTDRDIQLRFDFRHDIYFPKTVEISAELWSEYLAVFWNHPSNSHRYQAHGTYVKAGDICLDCGACEGTFALQALEAGARKVICIEPSSEMIRCLSQTLATPIAQGRVLVFHAALGAIDGTTTFTSDLRCPFGGSAGATTSTSQTPLRTLATICDELDLGRIDFVKMDIEGAEVQAIEGALRILDRDHPKLAITTYHRPFDYAALKVLLRAASYEFIKPVGCVARDDGIFRPVMLHAR